MTKKWLRMAEMYKHFAKPWNHLCDFSEEAKQAMFDYESKGIGNLKQDIFSQEICNGYALGKHWMDVNVSEWKRGLTEQDLGWTKVPPILYIHELLVDYPEWFLKKVGVMSVT